MKLTNSVKKTVFSHGLTLLTEDRTHQKTLALGAWIKVGSRHESEPGICHYLEHMLFKGTKTRTALDIARQIDQIGGDFNAFTTREYTCLHLTLLDTHGKLGLEILSDILLNSAFKNQEFEREKTVILQEIAMVEESPEELAHDLFFEKIYPKQGLGRSILGTQASIESMKRKDLINFFQRHYQPHQIIIAIAGNMHHETAIEALQPLNQSLGNKSYCPPNFSPPPAKFRPGYWWIKRPTEQVHFLWGAPASAYNCPDRFPSLLLNLYLGSGMSSVLFQEIREKHGLAYTIYSSLSSFSDTGLFSIYAATHPNQAQRCLDLLEKCIQRVKTRKISSQQLQLLQENLKNNILLGSDHAEISMSRLAKNELFFHRPLKIQEIFKKIDTTTAEDLKKVAQKYFQQQCLLILGPSSSKMLLKNYENR